jgi:integrase
LAGPRVSELCKLDNQDINLARARFDIHDFTTAAGVRSVDIHPRLLDELTSYRAGRAVAPMDAPAFPTRAGTRRDRSNVLKRVIHPALERANQLRAGYDAPPIRAHVTPHTFRRTYITFVVAAGFDLPYIQAQVGHVNPTTTLAVYAQMIARADRDQLRAEIRELLGIQPSERARPAALGLQAELSQPSASTPRPRIKASKGLTTQR